jgi:Zn-dependent metalloprotease
MLSATAGQRDLLARLAPGARGVSVRWDEARGIVSLLRGPRGVEGVATVPDFVRRFGPLFGPPGPGAWPRLLHRHTDPLGWTHLEYQQEHRPARGRRAAIPVYGSRLTLHFDASETLREIRSNCWREVAAPWPPKLTAAQAQKRLVGVGRSSSGPRAARRGERPPRLVVYPWRGEFRLAWTADGYATVGDPPAREPGDVFVDAVTGEVFQFFPRRLHVIGSGRGVTPIGGPYVLRLLQVEQAGPAHVLRDTSRPARPIVTYDDGCTLRGGSFFEQCDALMDHVVDPVTSPSRNPGGPDWLTTAATDASADREASQQPEVDAHFFTGEAYDWYAAVGGRVGWDDNVYAPVEPNLPLRVVTHTRDPNALTCHTAYSQFWRKRVDGTWRALIMFCDGNPSSTSPRRPNRIDFPAGCRALVGHEYQHVVTYFSFRSDTGDPGIGYAGWAAAFHEGLSDAFGCMFAREWRLGIEISREQPPAPIRNLAYPRDPGSWENRPGGLGHQTLDHFDDRSQPPANVAFGWDRAYDHGAILAHAAFLVAAGGVRRRDGVPGAAPLIPVRALPADTVNGRPISRAARIWYDGLVSYSATLGQVTASAIDENVFRGFRDACESAAIARYGTGTLEHRTTLLAFHAVGLDTPGEAYGPDLTFLPWAVEWRDSRPYLGGIRATCPDWSSIDLFVNNGGQSGWNAIVDAEGPNGPLGFENRVYCRLRNVGDRPASNITVELFWAKAGSAPTAWQPVTDRAGVVQTLTIAQLDAGALTFEEAEQDAPPAAAGVPWYIAPLGPGESVDHFCLRARATAADDVNPYNNEVQSNVAYTTLALGRARRYQMDFVIGNPRDCVTRVQTAWDAPPGWRIAVEPSVEELGARQQRPARLIVEIPEEAAVLAPPLDGEIRGRVAGPMSGRVMGAFTESRSGERGVEGRVSLDVEGVGVLLGRFSGRLEPRTGRLEGRVDGVFQHGARDTPVAVAFEGGLRPWRRVNVTQHAEDTVLGGFTLDVRLPAPPGWPADPPAATRADELV